MSLSNYVSEILFCGVTSDPRPETNRQAQLGVENINWELNPRQFPHGGIPG